MRMLRAMLCFFAVMGASAGCHADAPKPETTKPQPGKPLQLAAPAGDQTVQLELAPASEGYVCGEASDSFLMLGLTAKQVAQPNRQPMNLALVIDRSGSMESEDKLEHVKRAASFLIQNLQPTDRIALIAYDDVVNVLARSQLVGEDQKRLLRKIESLAPGNMTNIAGGLHAGYEQVIPRVAPEVISRVILLSDGLANTGVSDPRELGLIARNASAQGVSTTAMGVGVDYSEDTMMQVAEHGRGNYHFIGDPGQIPALFARELRELKATVAQDAVVSLELPAGAKVERVYGYDQADVGSSRLSLPIGDLWSGDNRRIIVRVRSSAGGPSALHASAHVRYRDAVSGQKAIARLATADAGMRCVKDEGEVHALRRPAIQHEVELVTSAEVMDVAMQDVNAGRKDEAKRKLDKNIEALAPVAEASGNAALKEQVSSLKRARSDLDALAAMPESAAEVQAYVKGNRASSKAMQKRRK
jgi:Ca-activated chloride channel family protein